MLTMLTIIISKISDGPFNYFCLDAASLLPVLMLDLKSGEHLLDICAGPGVKSLIAMQTLKPGKIVCNDIDLSSVNRVKYVMESFLIDKVDNPCEFSKNLNRHVKRVYKNYSNF